MPMHRELPDYVQINDKRYNFYDNPENEALVVQGLKYLKKLKPSYIKAIPNLQDMISHH